MKGVSIEELKQRFGPPLSVAPYGECLIVQGAEFDPDWEVLLSDRGFNCFNIDLDTHPVTLVQLKKRVAEGKVAYVPPAKSPKDARSNSVIDGEKEVEKMEKNEPKKAERTEALRERKQGGKRGLNWTPKEDAELLKAYDSLISEGKRYGIVKVIAAKFPDRSGSAAYQRLKRLLKKRGEKASKAAKSAPEKVVSKEPIEKFAEITKSTGDIEKTDSELAIEVLQQAYDALSKAYVEVKTELKKQQDFVLNFVYVPLNQNAEALKDLQAKYKKLRKKLARHKHAVGSGEAMLPLEDSS